MSVVEPSQLIPCPPSKASVYSLDRFLQSRKFYREKGINVELGHSSGDVMFLWTYRVPIHIICRKCHGRMVFRRRNADGEAFMGGQHWPRCTFTISLSPALATEARHWKGKMTCESFEDAQEVEADINAFRRTAGVGEITGYCAESRPKEAPVEADQTRKNKNPLIEAIAAGIDTAVLKDIDDARKDLDDARAQLRKDLLTTLPETQTVTDLAGRKHFVKIRRIQPTSLGPVPPENPLNKTISAALNKPQEKLDKMPTAPKGKSKNDETDIGPDEGVGRYDKAATAKTDADFRAFVSGRSTSMSIGQDITRRLKKSAGKSPARVLRMQALTRGKRAILNQLEGRIGPETYETIKGVLDTDAGAAAVLGAIGLVAPYVPKAGKDPRVQEVAEEFLDEGMAKGFNQVVDLMAILFGDVVEKLMESLPPVSEMAESVKAKVAPRKRKRIATSPRVRAVPKATYEELEAPDEAVPDPSHLRAAHR